MAVKALITGITGMFTSCGFSYRKYRMGCLWCMPLEKSS